jgi:ABC-type phosphate transport system substrate-binding protein
MKNILLLLGVFLIAGAANAQSYKIIVNSANSATSISKSEVSDYLLKKKTKWSSGEKVAPIDQSDKSVIREDFSKEVLGKSVGAVKSYWQQAVFAGTGTPPVEKKSDAEVVEFVKENTGAIGYVSAGASTSEVKVLTIN